MPTALSFCLAAPRQSTNIGPGARRADTGPALGRTEALRRKSATVRGLALVAPGVFLTVEGGSVSDPRRDSWSPSPVCCAPRRENRRQRGSGTRMPRSRRRSERQRAGLGAISNVIPIVVVARSHLEQGEPVTRLSPGAVQLTLIGPPASTASVLAVTVNGSSKA